MHVNYDKSMTYICHGRRERNNQEKHIRDLKISGGIGRGRL